MTALLEVSNLKTSFLTDDGEVTVVNGVSFNVQASRTLAIVGESGCGKSVTALSIMGLLAKPAGRIAEGSIRFEGQELVGASERVLQDLRGNGMSMIFQEPMTSLNPSYTVGEQIIEGLIKHRKLSRTQAREKAIDILHKVRIPSPEQRLDEFPHKLSGGMRQRVMIAMALVCEPRVLIADEPTTALDVTIQAQILELMRTLQQETGTAIVLITHDLGVVAEVADEVLVMYAGRVVERAPVHALFDMPQHPYTIGLLGAIPRLDLEQTRLVSIEGQVPSPAQPLSGCSFAPRCPFAQPACSNQVPALREVGNAHFSACLRAPLEADELLSGVVDEASL
ncbi:MAG: dipeptide ABC transporter ATP-binding protein DppD [Alcaligenaceae bacterium]|nr:MAG: dipeptide ABC transporter ATP-binding protein DppD [Alcaligenaceae bacterium]